MCSTGLTNFRSSKRRVGEMGGIEARFGLQAPSGAKPYRSRIGYRQEQIMALLPATFMDLHDATGMEKGNLSRAVAQLEHRGLVIRIRLGRSHTFQINNQ